MTTAWGIVALALLVGGAQAADLHATVHDDEGTPLGEAVIVAVPQAAAPRTARPQPEQVEQIDLEFVPRVKAIQVGAAVSFPNRDNVRHHVYSFSPAKRFELPLYAGTPSQPVVFDTPGIVTIGCNIHDWMVGYLYVAESPYIAVTTADGTADIAGMPAGRYAVRVWHPRLAVAEETTLQDAELGTARATVLEWRVKLKPEVRVRRAPASGRGGRY
jgi:plastocyanin